MNHAPLAALLLTTLLCYGAEPQPTLDPIPPAVRTAAIKMARGGVVDLFDVITHERRTLYQVRLVDSATDQPALATFAEDGSLVSIAPIPPREPQVPPEIRKLDPLPAPTDPGEPHRSDGKDAAPATRHGVDQPTR